MLDIRPNCELCEKHLPVDSLDACMCSYECTFCTTCVEDVLENVCPSCGGGFEFRPVRPKTAHRSGVSLADHKASTKSVITKFSREEISEFAKTIKDVPPELR
jgi:hypothetical protein